MWKIEKNESSFLTLKKFFFWSWFKLKFWLWLYVVLIQCRLVLIKRFSTVWCNKIGTVFFQWCRLGLLNPGIYKQYVRKNIRNEGNHIYCDDFKISGGPLHIYIYNIHIFSLLKEIGRSNFIAKISILIKEIQTNNFLQGASQRYRTFKLKFRCFHINRSTSEKYFLPGASI